MGRIKLFTLVLGALLVVSFTYRTEQDTVSFADYLKQENSWADSVFNSLSLEQRIAQLFMVAAYSNHSDKHEQEIQSLIETYNIGGLVFFQGGPVDQAQLTNRYQSHAQTPLLIAQDAENGFAMRLDSCFAFPQQMTLGAIENDSLLYEMAQEIAMQSTRLGVHVNFGPVVDVNNNRNNPVINERSYGEEVQRVVDKSLAFMHGLQDNGIIATAKHFPGHGDTDADSHKTLPTLNHDRARLDSVELVPFQALVDAGIAGIMTAHLFVPALDSTRNLASTLSKPIMTGVLKGDMGFDGLLFSDALNMRGVNAFYDPGAVEIEALLAGNDLLLLSEDVPLAIASIVKAVETGMVSEERINASCLKVLRAKQYAKLDRYKPVEMEGLLEDMNPYSSELLLRWLTQESLTLLNNENDLLPLQRLDTLKIAAVAINTKAGNTFHESMNRYVDMDFFDLSKKPDEEEVNALLDTLSDYNLVVLSVHDMNDKIFQNYGLSQEVNQFILDLKSCGHKVVLNLFGNPYALGKMLGAGDIDAIIVSYEETELAQDFSGQLVFGGIPAKGTLPVSASADFRAGDGVIQDKAVRFKYTIPEELGINPADLVRIDQLALEGISDMAYPGCQILVAKDGKVFYQKSFGHHTYDTLREVRNTDIYDLASITKIAASTASVMRMQSDSLMSVDSTLAAYVRDIVDSTEYADIVLREMLAHQAGLTSWIPFYLNTMHKGEPKIEYYSKSRSDYYTQRVAEDLYIIESARDSMLAELVRTPLGARKYKYSDLGYYFIMEIVERLSGQKLNEYADSMFYAPLGLQTMSYLPREEHLLDEIVPTEDDQIFRGQLVHGDVHDPGSAMMGGVGGHAGLFSNANDLAVMMQMFLNWGTYGGEQYMNEDIVQDFSTTQFANNDNRRGVGFDKPVTTGGAGPTCNCVSHESFGHTGFTGTIAWADPEENLVYIFLSNRINPSAENRKLISSGIRTRIQDAIYDAVEKARIQELTLK